MAEWQSMGVLNFEMESATLFTMCASQGLRAGCVAGVLVNRTKQETPDEETAKRIESTSVTIVVEAAAPQRCPDIADRPELTEITTAAISVQWVDSGPDPTENVMARSDEGRRRTWRGRWRR